VQPVIVDLKRLNQIIGMAKQLDVFPMRENLIMGCNFKGKNTRTLL
jgi:hypothetical protein